MKKLANSIKRNLQKLFDSLGLGLRAKLIIIFLLVKIIPLMLILAIAWTQFIALGEILSEMAVQDSSEALNNSAIENIERMTTDTALKVAEFLYGRDDDIIYLAKISASLGLENAEAIEEIYRLFIEAKQGRVVKQGEWDLSADGKSWQRVKNKELLQSETEREALDMIMAFIKQAFNERLTEEERADPQKISYEKRKELHELSESQIGELRKLGLADERIDELVNISSNQENNDPVSGTSFNYRLPDNFEYEYIPLYDEITFVGPDGQELIKVTAENSPKKNYEMNKSLGNVSEKANTYVKAENYFAELTQKRYNVGDIYVSDVTGAYVGADYIGMYAPEIFLSGDQKIMNQLHPNLEELRKTAKLSRDEFKKSAEEQAFAGRENPNGQRFEGIVRWATPVAGDDGEIIGYVTFALNHDHIMEFVDRITPMDERYNELTSAYEGNYAFIWDYECRSICHPRHNSIVGFDPETGEPQVPWLETSIYEAWQASGTENWVDFVNANGVKTFDDQSRTKKPAADLTRAGYVGLDGRYLNNAPQCTGWMDLTKDGGSGSFYILWSGLYKLTTAAAIPYYTGKYAPSEDNNNSKRGFGFVTIGAGLDDFQNPALETKIKLTNAIDDSLGTTLMRLLSTAGFIVVLIIFIAILLASYLTKNIRKLINGISLFRQGRRQFRFNSEAKDEFGTLADSFDDMANSIVSSVSRPLSIVDMKRKIIYMNEYVLDLLGKKLDEVEGKPYYEQSLYVYRSQYCPITALEEGRTSEIFYSDKNDCYLQGVATYLLDKKDRKIGYIITSTDVTDMVRTQLKLENAVNDANTASRHKGEFLARMSHEIRTPMNAIIGLLDIMQRKFDSIISGGVVNIEEVKEIKSNADHIETSSRHLLGLLNDILDITKIEAGKIEIAEEKTDLSKLIGTVAEIIRPRCEDKNIKFEVIVDSFENRMYLMDSLRLRQVLINLLGNAVKFTNELGVITFRAFKKEELGEKTLIGFSVRDTGIGIPEDRLSAVFEAFEQGDSKTSNNYGGTGLGLAISRSIVRLMGGDIELISKPGEGSEFKFAIWLKECEAERQESEIPDITGRFAGKKVLLVDDVDINRMIVSSMLEIAEMEIDEACDGVEALQKFTESEAGDYSIILMDIRMPNMDGYECAEAIRNLDRPDAKTVPIIALTANAFKEDIDAALSKGMNAHIAKPIEMDRLSVELCRFLEG